MGRWASFSFVLVATANGGGYRYGTSDQAFYIPVVVRALEPAAFPHDASLIDSQGRLMLADEAVATLVRVTGLPLDVLFLAAYLRVTPADLDRACGDRPSDVSVGVADGGARRGVHAAAPDSPHQRQLV